MTIKAKIITDSINLNGVRLTTMQLKYHRFIHSEFMTHRVFSRNASSSRAIPVMKMIEQVETDPAIPVHWGRNQSGMQAKGELDEYSISIAKNDWLSAAKSAAESARLLSLLGLHKQVINRLLEPFQWIHVVVTATEWDNFYALRDHPDAQPEIQALAQAMKEAHNNSAPTLLEDGEWHLPYIKSYEHELYTYQDLLKFSAARCARVSYLNHDKSDPSPEKDIDLHDKLTQSNPPHMSPVEHQAQSRLEDKFFANFRGWKQYRTYLEQIKNV